ncbi:hypothetical protein D3C71_609130 [compost metagenome]
MKETIHKSEKSSGSPFRSRGRDPFAVQAKLAVNQPGDQHETEADSAADRVVSGSSPTGTSSSGDPASVQLKPIAQTVTPYIQRKEGPDQMGQLDVEGTEDKMGDVEHEGTIQRKEEDGGSEPEPSEETEVEEPDTEEAEEAETPEEGGDEGVQMKEDDDAPVQTKRFDQAPPSNNIGSQLQNSKGQGSPLPSDVKTEMETGFGADFSNVKIHTGTQATEMNQSLRAKAFTNKGDIYFNQGKFDPASKDGKFLLAHELTHTIQQGAAAPKADLKQDPAQQAETNSKDKKETQALSESEASELKVVAPQSKGAVVPPAAKEGKTADPKTGKKDKNGKTVEEGEVSKEEAAPEKKKPDPKADPNFIEVTRNIAVTADKQSAHQPAEELSEDSQEAALSPGNERESIAQADQVDEMEEVEPKPFNADAFKAKLMERIASMQLPENQDQADKFEKNNNIDEVNQQAVGDVNSEKDASVGPVATTSQAAPQTEKVPERKTVPLNPLEKGKKPGDVGAAKAVPPKRGEEEVSQPLQEQTAEVDQRMAENEVTDQQLEKSEEPKFTQALDSKKDAKAKAEEAPKNFREKEDESLQGSATKSNAASKEQLAGMHAMRGGAFQKVMGNQKDTGKKDTSERERIAGDINGLYETTKKEVEGILDTLEERVASMFEATAEKAKAVFETYIETKMAWYKAKRYSGPDGALKWGWDLFAGLPDEVNEFFVEGKKVFAKVMEAGITVIATIVASELNRAQSRIKQGKTDVTKYVESLPKNLRHLGKEAASEIQEKFSALQEDVNSREEALIETIAQEYVAAVQEVDERIEEMKAANRGLIDAVMGFINGVIETIMKLKEMITNLFAAIKSVIGVIMADPIGFMGNLFDGIGKGIDAFKANIQQHLLGGLLEWLTGSLGPIGITMPKDIFSLSGIFSLVLQVLGLGWEYIRLKAVKMMGEPVVKALEGGFLMFQTFASKGIDGIWEFLKDKFTDLKETVIDAIKDMLITQVIQAGIKWLLSLLIPGAGFIKAIMAIKDLIVFFVESAIMLIPALTEAILALAVGSVAGVAKAIEFGLAKLIGLVINLFAKLIGLGGLSKKVQAIFKKIRKRVDKAVNKMLKKAKKAGRKLLSKLNVGKKGSSKKIKEENKKGKPDDLTPQDKAQHKKIVKSIKKQLSEGSKEGESFEQFHKRKTKEAGELEDKYQPTLKKGINLDIKFGPLAQDKKDNDIDFKISIAPNTEKDDGDAKFELAFPPKGKAFILRESNPRHFKIVFSTKFMYDLELLKGDIIKLRTHDFTQKSGVNVEKESFQGKNYITVNVKEQGVQKITKGKIDDMQAVYRERGYRTEKEANKPITDCFSFIIELLQSGPNASISMPKGDDNNARFENLKNRLNDK